MFVVDFTKLTTITPVKTDVLRQYLNGYWNASYIVNGFTLGFALGLVPVPCLSTAPQKLVPIKPSLQEKLDLEVRLGRIVGPFPCAPIDDLMVSPLTAIPKPNSNKTRLIFNLSVPVGTSVNDNILEGAKSVSYCCVGDVAQWLLDRQTKEVYMAKVDLADAYRIVPIRKEDWQYLGMKLGGSYYVDRCLPMGAASSCKVFQTVSDAIVWMFESQYPGQVKIFNYLDDFLLLADSQSLCDTVLDRFLSMLNSLGIPVSPHKTIRASTSIVFLGIGIDTVAESLFLPEDKASTVLQQLESFLTCSKPTVRQWQKILGKLCHLSTIVMSGRILLSSVYGSLQGILSQDQSRRRSISSEVRKDLLVWVKFLTILVPGKQFRMFRPPSTNIPTIASDASSSVGFGVMFGARWFYGRWPSDKWRQLNIAFLELYPIYVAIKLWGSQSKDGALQILCDNHAMVLVINKLYSKDALIRKLCRPLALEAMTLNIQLVARHVKGAMNVGPDLLSRGKVDIFKARFPMMNSDAVELPSHLWPVNFEL